MKKILSVFLSLVLIFTTISVMFTVPASAVTVSLIDENFDSYASGDSLGATNVIPQGNGWFITSANYLNTVVSPATDTLGAGSTEIPAFNAKSGNNVAKFTSWSKQGYVANVTPGVTYTFKASLYTAGVDQTSVWKSIQVYDISGTEGQTATENWERSTVKINGVKITNASTATNQNSINTWCDFTLSYTPSENVTKVLFGIWSEHNSSAENKALKHVYVDDFSITYDAVPTVTSTTFGADSKNGGVAWVSSDLANVKAGDTITYSAKPYENASFDGWYVDGVKQDTQETTLKRVWNASEKIEAKFKAEFVNVFPEGSFEKYVSATAKPSGSSSTGVLVWGSWNTTHATPNAENWVGTNYGRGYTANNAYLSSLVSGVSAFSGNTALVHQTGSHAIGKIVDVTPNTDYVLTYYTYSSQENAITNKSVIGIDMSAGNVYLGSSTNGNNMSFDQSGTENKQTKLSVNELAGDTTTINQWVKQQVSFNSGDYENVIISISKNGKSDFTGELFIDHISLHADLRIQPEVTTTTVGEGANGGYAWVSTGKVNEGEDITYNAKPYANAKFLGWYKNDILYRTEETFTESYDSDSYVQLEARFDAFATNLDYNGSSETYDVGNILTNNTKSPWDELDIEAWVGIDNTNYPNLAKMYYGALSVSNTRAYSGNKSLVNAGGSGSHGFYKIYDVEPNSTYHFSYWYYQESVKLETEGGYAHFPDGAIIASDADKAYIKGTSKNTSNQLITNEHQKVIDMFIDTPNVYYKGKNGVNEWTEVKYTFVTGENDTRVVIPMPKPLEVSFDHFTLYKEPEFESAYSFAVVPDTQKFNDDKDTNDYDINAAFPKLYDDILAKKDSKNIQMVIGLGDVTENSISTEFARAREQFARLDAAGLPYSTIMGNHDYTGQFKNGIPYAEHKSTAVGSYNGMSNTYHKFTVNGIKYLVLGLEIGPADDVLDWANKVVENNPDYNVIVTTHAYLNSKGVRIPEDDGLSSGAYGTNHADTVWNNFISKHKNINMILCGHIDYDAIRITESKGVNDNTVLEMLIDGQDYDEYPRNANLEYDNTLEDVAYGMVAYFNFSADGKKLNIEYYSTNLEKLIYEVTVDVNTVSDSYETLKVISDNNGNVYANGMRGNNLEITKTLNTQVELTAEPYKNLSFLGWYDGEELLSTETTYTASVSNKTIYAKFEPLNVISDSSFESYDIGKITNWNIGSSCSTWANVNVVDSVDYPRSGANALPYSGNRMLAINHRNNQGLSLDVSVEQYADYSLSLKYLLTLAYGDLTYNDAVVNSKLDKIFVTNLDGTVLSTKDGANSDGTWTDFNLTFNSKGNDKIRINIEYTVDNASNYGLANGTGILYIDDLALIKTRQGEAPVITAGDLNEDGEVDAKDLLLIRKYYAGWDVSINEDLLDINGDGYKDSIDVIYLAKHLAKWSGFEVLKY